VDVFYPFAGTVFFSKEGVFQQPRLFSSTVVCAILSESDSLLEKRGYSMLRLPVGLILVFLLFASPCLPQTTKAHSDDSIQDRVCLSEVLINAPPSDAPAQVTEASHKAEGLRKAVHSGNSFADLAKANSQGPTAAQGGPIGCFKRGQLSKELEERVFPLQAGDVSDVLRTKQGFVILQVTERSPQ
jgi:hypothetical protein